MINFIKSFRQV